jgi:hypothetical protein
MRSTQEWLNRGTSTCASLHHQLGHWLDSARLCLGWVGLVATDKRNASGPCLIFLNCVFFVFYWVHQETGGRSRFIAWGGQPRNRDSISSRGVRSFASPKRPD